MDAFPKRDIYEYINIMDCSCIQHVSSLAFALKCVIQNIEYVLLY